MLKPFSAALLAACCLVSPAALAVPPDAGTYAKADELFRAGRAAADAGDNKTACERFSESEDLEPAPGTQLNLGACEEALGHILAAREHFRLAAAGFRPEDRRRPLATARANDLSKRLGHLTVRLGPDVPTDARVTAAGAPIDPKALEKALDVDPGKIAVTVTAAGRVPQTYDVDVGEGQSRDLVVNAGKASAPLGPAAAPESLPASVPASVHPGRPSPELLRLLGFVGASVGAAGILTGSIFGGLALHEASVVKSNCTTALACQPPGVSAASSGKTDTVVSTTAFIAGGVFAAAGVYLVITNWKVTSGGADNRPTQAALKLTPIILSSGGGFASTWSF